MTNLVKWINEGEKTDEHMRFLLEAEDAIKRGVITADVSPDELWELYQDKRASGEMQ